MIAFVLSELGLDPAWLVGGEIAQLDGNAGAGEGWLVVEGDESDRTVERLRPEIGVVTNVELDHHSTFGSAAEVEAMFDGWLAEVPQVVRGWELEPVSFELALPGRAQPAQRRDGARRARARGRRARRRRAGARALPRRRAPLRARRRDGRCHRRRRLRPSSDRRSRRPSRLRASARTGRVLVLFQPHLYSRTRHLAHELGAALSTADAACVTEIYRAREEPVAGRRRQARRRRAPPGHARGLDAGASRTAPRLVASWARPGDLVLTVGAGDVERAGPLVLEALA